MLGEEKGPPRRFYCILNYHVRETEIPIGHLFVKLSTTKHLSPKGVQFSQRLFAAHGEQTRSVNYTPVSKWKPRSSMKPIAFVEPGLYSRSKYILFSHHRKFSTRRLLSSSLALSNLIFFGVFRIYYARSYATIIAISHR